MPGRIGKVASAVRSITTATSVGPVMLTTGRLMSHRVAAAVSVVSSFHAACVASYRTETWVTSALRMTGVASARHVRLVGARTNTGPHGGFDRFVITATTNRPTRTAV